MSVVWVQTLHEYYTTLHYTGGTAYELLHVYAIVAARLFPSPKGESRSEMSVVWCSVCVV